MHHVKPFVHASGDFGSLTAPEKLFFSLFLPASLAKNSEKRMLYESADLTLMRMGLTAPPQPRWDKPPKLSLIHI